MARTSKTKIGNSGESNDRMMRAAASGAEAVSQAHGQLMGQHRANRDTAAQTAQIAGQIVGQGEERNQQESQFARGLEQRKSETELEAAKAGFEPNSPKGDRASQLDAEMEKGQQQPGQIGPIDPESQQRLAETAKEPLEMDGQGRWRPTAERKAQTERTQKREDFQADTERMRAQAYHEQVAVSAQKALRSGDKEAYEENAQILANVPNDRQKQYDRLMKGDMHEGDWGDLAKLAKGSSEMEPTLEADIKAQNFTPRVAAFMRAQVGLGSLKAIVGSMGDTTKLKIDWTNPVMVQFQQMVQSENEFMRANPAIGTFAAIKSTEDKMRFLNVMAAAKVAAGMGRAPASPSGGMMPATAPGAPGAAAAPGSEPMVPPGGTQVPGRAEGAEAVRGARAGGASPQQALEAGQRVNPTANFGAQAPRSRDSDYTSMRRAGL